MTDQVQLHEALTRLLEAIAAGGSASAGPSLTDCIARLDQLRDELDEDAPAMLRHYLEKRSYEKALAFLEGRDETQKPGC